MKISEVIVNWEAVGAVGEIIGGAAVVLTLAYLAFQIRYNTRATRASAREAVTQSLITACIQSVDVPGSLSRPTPEPGCSSIDE